MPYKKERKKQKKDATETATGTATRTATEKAELECILNDQSFTLKRTQMIDVPENVMCFSIRTPWFSLSKSKDFRLILPSYKLSTVVSSHCFNCMKKVDGHNVIMLPLSPQLAAHIYTIDIPQELIDRDSYFLYRYGVDCIVVMSTCDKNLN